VTDPPPEVIRDLQRPPIRWGWEYRPPLVASWTRLRNEPPDPRLENYAAHYARWKQQVLDEESRFEDIEQHSAVWYPVVTGAKYPVVAIFGGTTNGWRALLTTAGASMIGAGARLIVVNATDRAVTDDLKAVAELAGRSVRSELLAVNGSTCDFLSGIASDHLISLLLGTLYGDARTNRLEVTEDRTILELILGALEPPVSLPRLRSSLQYVIRQTTPDSGPAALTGAEEDRVLDLFSSDIRERGDLVRRVARLAGHVAAIVSFQPTEPRPTVADVLHSDLALFTVAPNIDPINFELAGDMLVQSLVDLLRGPQTNGIPVVVVVGADRLDRHSVDALANAAASGVARVVLVHAHLDEQSRYALAAQGSCALFMRLASQPEAQLAADHVGRDFKMVLGQETTTFGHSDDSSFSTGSSRESSVGSSSGDSLSSPSTTSASAGSGTSASSTRSHGVSFSRSQTHQRVQEYTLDPTTFQALPETAFVSVDTVGARRITAGDCEPLIATYRRLAWS
jgi:hypothetical protein